MLNGAVRDFEEIGQGEFPLYAAGVTHRGPYKDGPGEINVPIAIDGMVIHPGDLIWAMPTACCACPSTAEEVLAATRKKMEAEKKTLADIAAGKLDTAWIDARLKRIGCNPDAALMTTIQECAWSVRTCGSTPPSTRAGPQAGVSLSVFPVRGHPAAAWDLLAGAHVYHVSAAKDELPREWFARAELLARCPNLLCVSSCGAGYDTVDVAACTAAGRRGGEPGRRQRRLGGGTHARR